MAPRTGGAELEQALRDPARLATLAAADLLQPTAEEAFDRITKTAARLLAVPVSLVSLVDERRQYFKSMFGHIPEPWDTDRETDLDHSFCKHVVADGLPLVVSDARADPSLKQNLAIADLGVVAYLGAPLRTEGGAILGSFCAIDTAPREWTLRDIETVVDFAEIASREVTSRIRAREVERDRARLATILESAVEGILGLDLGGTITFANPAAENLLGRPAATLIGYPAHELLHRVEGGGSICGPGPCEDERLVRSGRAVTRDTTLCRADGSTFPARFTAGVKREGPAAAGAVMLFTDRTGEVELERQRREFADRFRALFDNSPDAILLTSPDGKILEANDAACEMFGRTLEELRELGRGAVVDADDPRLPELIRMRAERGFASGTLRMRRADGTMFEADISSTVFVDGAGRKLTSMSIRDVSERVRLDAELRQTATRLEERIAAERQFEEVFGHELRTPLVAMTAFAALLRRGAMSLERACALADQLEKDATRAGRLIDELLQLDRVESGRERILAERVDLGDILAQVMATVGAASPRHTLSLAREGDLVVRGDRDRLVQVFTNVVENAVKYSPDGGPVQIASRAADRGVATTVCDHGLGIAPEDLERIFQKHFRAGTGRHDIVGSGLGLQLARAIVEKHDGRIWAESDGEGAGATFTVLLPAEKADPR